MILYFLRALTEYVSIVLCLHKIAEKKVKISWYSVVWFGIYINLVFLAEYIAEYCRYFQVLIYVFWLLYVKIRLAHKVKDSLKIFGIMVITIPTLQMVLYAIIASFVRDQFNNPVGAWKVEILLNIIICFIFLLWKKHYLYDLGIRLKIIYKVAIFLVVTGVFIYVLLIYINNDVLDSRLYVTIIVCMVIWGLTIILLESAEMEKKRKAEELQLYEQYTHVFEDALTTIRMRQHEFDNHINAILCMQYVIKDREELIREQQKYCAVVLKENIFNKVLFLKVPPILSGYLYFKFTIAADKGLLITYEIGEMEQVDRISMNDLVETIGILFDNAVEALSSNGKHKLRVCVCYDSDNRLVVEIANESDRIPNDVIGNFFRQGYSTKEKDRGLGLSRLNDLKKKYKGELSVVNISIDNINYLQFRIIYGKRVVSFHKRIGFGMHNE